MVDLLDYSFLFVGIDDEIFDVFREHRQSFILLRVHICSCELNVLRIDHHRTISI